MAFGTNIVGSASLDPIKQCVKFNLFLRELIAASKFRGLVKDVTSMGVVGYKSVEFPSIDTFEAIDKECETPNDTTAITMATEELLFDKMGYLSLALTDCCALETNINYEAELIKRASQAIARHVDHTIATDLFAAAQSYTATASVKDDIISMIYNNKCKFAEDQVIVIDCAYEAELMKVAEFTSNDIYGRPVLLTGQLGQILGVPLISCVGLEAKYGSKAIVFSRNASYVGFQKELGFLMETCGEYGTAAKRLTWDNKYGHKVTHLGKQGVAATESPWITKLV